MTNIIIQFIRFAAQSFQNFSDNVTGISLATFLIIIAPMSDPVHYLFIIIHRAQLRIQSIIQIRNNRILVVTRPTIPMLIIVAVSHAPKLDSARRLADVSAARTFKLRRFCALPASLPRLSPAHPGAAARAIIATILAATFCNPSRRGGIPAPSKRRAAPRSPSFSRGQF